MTPFAVFDKPDKYFIIRTLVFWPIILMPILALLQLLQRRNDPLLFSCAAITILIYLGVFSNRKYYKVVLYDDFVELYYYQYFKSRKVKVLYDSLKVNYKKRMISRSAEVMILTGEVEKKMVFEIHNICSTFAEAEIEKIYLILEKQIKGLTGI